MAKRRKNRKKEEVFVQMNTEQNNQVEDLVLSSVTLGKTANKTKFKYSPAFPHLAYRLALLGLTNQQMAKIFNVSEITFYTWLQIHHEFREAIQKGKEKADGDVVETLLKTALGFTQEEEVVLTNRIKKYNSETGKLEEEHVEPLFVKTQKTYPPNVKAAIYWLARRHPDVWGSTKRLEVGVQMTVNQINMNDFDDKELEVLEKMGLSKLEQSKEED